jgi:hypothetical protein
MQAVNFPRIKKNIHDQHCLKSREQPRASIHPRPRAPSFPQPSILPQYYFWGQVIRRKACYLLAIPLQNLLQNYMLSPYTIGYYLSDVARQCYLYLILHLR